MAEHLKKEDFLSKVFDYEKNKEWKYAGDHYMAQFGIQAIEEDRTGGQVEFREQGISLSQIAILVREKSSSTN